MKEMLRYGFILSIICIFASASLALVNSFTNDQISAQAKREEEAALKEVLSAGEDFKAVRQAEEVLYYKAYNKDAGLVGVVFKVSAKGYSSTIQTMVGMTLEGKITAIKVLAQNETPGLGTRVLEPSFSQQFRGRGAFGLNEIQAITGATISSRAVIDAVREKAGQMRELIKNER